MSFPAPVSATLLHLPVIRASDLRKTAVPGSWRFQTLVGILSELSEATPCGALSVAADIILEAQREREPVAWVAGPDSIFYPPDLAGRGIDVSAVAVIRGDRPLDSLRCAEWLVRCGAFGLVVVDAEGEWRVSDSSLGRLQKLAERNQCAVLFLTRKTAGEASLGTRISRRGCVARGEPAACSVEILTLKDTVAHRTTRERRQYRGPAGMH